MNSPTSEWESVVQRLRRLETQQRWLKRLLTAAGVLAGAVVLSGQSRSFPAVQPLVRAKTFSLVDDEGRVQGSIKSHAEGPSFVLSDARGRRRITLALYKDGPMFSLADEHGHERLNLFLVDGQDKRSGPRISAADEKGTVRMFFSANTEGTLLTLSDADGKTLFSAP